MLDGLFLFMNKITGYFFYTFIRWFIISAMFFVRNFSHRMHQWKNPERSPKEFRSLLPHKPQVDHREFVFSRLKIRVIRMAFPRFKLPPYLVRWTGREVGPHVLQHLTEFCEHCQKRDFPRKPVAERRGACLKILEKLEKVVEKEESPLEAFIDFIKRDQESFDSVNVMELFSSAFLKYINSTLQGRLTRIGETKILAGHLAGSFLPLRNTLTSIWI